MKLFYLVPRTISTQATISWRLSLAEGGYAAILEAWRDGYAGPIGELTPITRESAWAYFNQMISNVRDPQGYAVWMVPVVSARLTGKLK